MIAVSGRTAVYRDGRQVLACRDRSRRVLVTLNRGQRLEAAAARSGFVAVGVVRLEETIIGWEHRRVIRVFDLRSRIGRLRRESDEFLDGRVSLLRVTQRGGAIAVAGVGSRKGLIAVLPEGSAVLDRSRRLASVRVQGDVVSWRRGRWPHRFKLTVPRVAVEHPDRVPPQPDPVQVRFRAPITATYSIGFFAAESRYDPCKGTREVAAQAGESVIAQVVRPDECGQLPLHFHVGLVVAPPLILCHDALCGGGFELARFDLARAE